MKPAILCLAIATSTLCGLALAQPAEKANPCRADLEKFCKNVKPGEGRIVKCLAQHEAELSGTCRASIAEGKKRAEQSADACKPDLEKHCKGVQPGEGRIARCLVEKKDQLSPACRKVIEEGERKHPCYADTLRLCKDVKPGEGRIVECMKRNESQLSAACKAKIAEEHPQAQKGKK